VSKRADPRAGLTTFDVRAPQAPARTSASDPQLPILERGAVRLARWLDARGEVPAVTRYLGWAMRRLGVRSLREGQLDVILAALRGESVLLVSPTGSGKTLCFQLPALLTPGTAYVISPLKALMSEQVADLTRRQIAATFINSDLSPADKRQRYQALRDQGVKFFFVTPERFDETLVSPHEITLALGGHPAFLVVDEAHCIDRWGRDFRPAYSRLGVVRQRLGAPPVLAFTATAGAKAQRRILDSLGVPQARVVVTGVDRPNISLLRLPLVEDEARLRLTADLLRQMPVGRAMVFVPTIKVGQLVQAGLQGLGLELPFYHARMGSAQERERLLARFLGREQPAAQAVICTNAFGLGLDVPDVRLAVHWQQPASVEDYVQEFGRAGRDGKPAVAVLFTRPRETGLLRFMAEKTVEQAGLDEQAAHEALKIKLEAIEDLHALVTQRQRCFRRELLGYFQLAGPQRPAQSAPRSAAQRLLEWAFVEPARQTPARLCCDGCSPVTPATALAWASRVWRTG
jgi:ATP-dependent DNA helicase RecQ